MPRTYRTPKEIERFLICDFLHQLSYRIFNPVWQDRPDALLTISDGNFSARTAIELTDYFNDTQSGTMSPNSPVSDFWRLVQTSLLRRISHRRHLTGLNARVHFLNSLCIPRSSNDNIRARKLAAELVDFVEKHPVRINTHECLASRDFVGYTELRSSIDRIVLSRWTDDDVYPSRCAWTCDNLAAGHIGCKLDYITGAIGVKNEKAKKYPNWGNASEKWLLIAASGNNVSNRAGPSMQDVDWEDSNLRKLCGVSIFDRIVFWERVSNWYKWVKPNEKLVQL